MCEEDLNGKKRVKDPAGNYYCPMCWEARLHAARVLGDEPQDRVDADAFAEAIEPVAAKPATLPPPAMKQQPVAPVAPAENVLLKKLGFLGVGVLAVLFFDLWPIMQVMNRADHITISFKGMFAGWFLLTACLAALLPEGVGIAWQRTKGQKASGREKVVIWLVMGLSVAATAASIWFVENQGYTIKF